MIALCYLGMLALMGYLGLQDKEWNARLVLVLLGSTFVLYMRFVWLPFGLWFTSFHEARGFPEEKLMHECLVWVYGRLRSFSLALDRVDAGICPHAESSVHNPERKT